jgi:hypothetical protein
MADVEVGVDTPVEPVTAEVVTPAPGSTAEPVVEKPEGAEPQAPEPEKMLTQSEVNKLIQKRERLAESRALKIARAEAERDFYKKQLEERERAVKQPENAQEPQPEDFNGDPRAYVKALIKWERAQEREQEREEQKRETATERQERSMAERARIAEEKLFRPGAAKYRDFNEVVLSDDVPITEVMVAATARLKNGVDVLYHLGNNRDEAYRIAQLPDIEQAWELKALESKLSAPPKPTQTPAPIVPSGGSAPTKKGWEGMSTAEHVESWLKRKHR